jgi:hypothetical protein
MNTNKREQQRSKKNLDTYQRQVRRNQILFVILSVVLILSMIITAFIQI